MIYTVTRGHAVRHWGREKEVERSPNRYISTRLKKRRIKRRENITGLESTVNTKTCPKQKTGSEGSSVSVPFQVMSSGHVVALASHISCANADLPHQQHPTERCRCVGFSLNITTCMQVKVMQLEVTEASVPLERQ